MFDFHWNALNLKRLDILRENKKKERFACQTFLFLKINYILNLDDKGKTASDNCPMKSSRKWGTISQIFYIFLLYQEVS